LYYNAPEGGTFLKYDSHGVVMWSKQSALGGNAGVREFLQLWQGVGISSRKRGNANKKISIFTTPNTAIP
jgi:hypothetical protein